MSEAILIAVVVAVVITILFLHAHARRSTPATENTARSVPDQTGCEPAGGSREFASLPDPNMWRSAVVLDLSAAEELLDLAEREGYQERELIVLGNSTFLVRWRDRAQSQSREPS